MSVQQFDLGETVYCDFCGDDYSQSTDCGGLLFGSYATCPKCAPKIEADAMKYGEQNNIRERCPSDMEFRKWCLGLRGGNNLVTIIDLDFARKLANASDG